jgi:hypothetical protein
MFPVCVGIATAAMFSGISGAAMLMQVFLIGFPLLGVPTLTTVAAVGCRCSSRPRASGPASTATCVVAWSTPVP